MPTVSTVLRSIPSPSPVSAARPTGRWLLHGTRRRRSANRWRPSCRVTVWPMSFQALGGWFGFGMYDALQSATQQVLASFAPSLAMMGKELALSTPGRVLAETGAPVFRHGSAASDDVHAILE